MSETPREQAAAEHAGSRQEGSDTAQEEQQVSPEEFENDPARNPTDEALKSIKGA